MSTVKFNPERLHVVLLAPVISEKSTMVAEKNDQVIFKVARDATKPEIKAAVELLFKVEVERVQVVNTMGKVKRFAKYMRPGCQFRPLYRVCLIPVRIDHRDGLSPHSP